MSAADLPSQPDIAALLVPVFRDGQPVADRLGYRVLLGAYATGLVAVASLTLRELE